VDKEARQGRQTRPSEEAVKGVVRRAVVDKEADNIKTVMAADPRTTPSVASSAGSRR
jgi:hypothetical protein